MVVVDEYFHDLMKKILKSYDIMKNLGETRDDLFALDVELTKINGKFSREYLRDLSLDHYCSTYT